MTGELTKVLLLAALFALPISLGLLRVYRRQVVEAMRRGAPSQAPPAEPAAQAVPGAPPAAPLTIIRLNAGGPVAPTEDALVTALRRRPWRTAAVHGVAGMALAAVMAVTYVVAMTSGIGLMAWAQLAWTLAWPAALTVIIVAASSSADRVRVLATYFAGLLVVNGVALARSPNLTAPQLAMGWLAINLPPSLILALFLARPIRAVGPLVLAFLIAALAGVEGAVALAGRPGLLRAISDVGAALQLSAPAVFGGILLAGFAALAPLGWFINRWLAAGYAGKAISDQSVTVDAVWLMFGVEQALVLVPRDAPAWLAVLPAAFVLYKLVARIGFTRRGARPKPAGAPQLLLLRAFSLGRASERLFDAVTLHWRHLGTVQLIAGPDLATTTIEPHEFLDFLRGRLARRFIDGQETMDRRFAELDLGPDQDGRFRVNEFFCYDDTWRAVLRRLAAATDVAVMDLRGFSRRHAGLAFEIEALIHDVELPRIVALVDAGTDEAYLGEVAQAAWRTLPADSPNRAAVSPALRLFPAGGAHRAPMPLLRAIAAAARPATTGA